MFRLSSALFSLVHFFTVIGISFLGFLLILVGNSPSARAEMANALLSKGSFWIWAGAALLIIGVLLAMGFYVLNRKLAFRVHMQPIDHEVDSDLIGRSITQFWTHTFPTTPAAIEVRVHPDQKIEILAEISQIPQEQEEFLEKAEEVLGYHLAHLLDYKKDYYVTFTLKT